MRRLRTQRRGSILPMTVLLILVICAFVALAIDLGVMVLARNQAQNAADAGAVAGARAINGNPDTNYNLTEAPKRAVAATIANDVLSKQIAGDPQNLMPVTQVTLPGGGGPGGGGVGGGAS